MIEVAQPSSRNHPVVYRQGQGNHAWMGGGMYVCTMSPDDAQSPKKTTYKPKWQVSAVKSAYYQELILRLISSAWQCSPTPLCFMS
jgi:hypothetical protein